MEGGVGKEKSNKEKMNKREEKEKAADDGDDCF